MKLDTTYLLVLGFLNFQLCLAQETTKVFEDLEIKSKKAIENMDSAQPDKKNPLVFQATLVWSNNKTHFAVIVKITILENWHIYAHVPQSQPYIASKISIEFPDGVNTVTDWKRPKAYPIGKGIYVYKDESVFIRYFSLPQDSATQGEIACDFYYQSCNAYQCYPPKNKTILLNI